MPEEKEVFEAQNDKAVDLVYTGREITIREVVRADGTRQFKIGNSKMKNIFEVYGVLVWATNAVGYIMQIRDEKTDAPQNKG